jgi:uncharacterized membrane protein YphA (DoxX/SURF4 family)
MDAEVVGHTPVDTQEQVRLVLRLALGLIFFVSAVAKLRDPVSFVRGVLEYQVLPRPLARVYGWLLPFVELGTALLLLSGFLPVVSAGLAVLMLVSFVIAIVMVAGSPQHTSCYCFGTTERGSAATWATLVRDLTLLAPALWLLQTAFTRPESVLIWQQSAGQLVPSAILGALLLLLYVLLVEGFGVLMGSAPLRRGATQRR